jgi:hypothetical protein
MNIHILVEASHALGKDRGFWAEEKDLREELLYIFSNIGDIAKSFKNKKRANWQSYESLMLQLEDDSQSESIYIEMSKKVFEKHIKDTFEDEITNVILRITDLMGGKKINIADTHPWVETYEYTELNYFFRNTKPTEEYDGKLANWLNEAMAACLLSSEKDTDYGLSHILFHLSSLIEFYDIDIERHLIKKIEYNRLRPLLYKS